MSNALALAGVTAVLQYYLEALYSSAGVSSNFPSAVTVSCLAPDQVKKLIEVGKAENENQVNIFLHQVTHNAAWRNVDFASKSSDGTTRTGNPPLALNLHYLLTVYGSASWQSEALLGFALMMLYEAPVLTRNDITSAISEITNPLSQFYSTNTLNSSLDTTGIEDQIELMKITPESMSREELAWLWTALKADYRTTFPFQVSVVLMQPDLPMSFALPVLQTVFAPGQPDSVVPMQPPQILTVQTPSGQMGATPGSTVTVTGEFLTGANQVSLSNTRYGVQFTIPVTQSQGELLSFALPSDAAGEYPAGVYDLTVQFINSSSGTVQVSSNTLPLAVAPSLPATQTATTVVTGSTTTVTISSFSPAIWEGQEVILSLSVLGTPYTSVSAQAEPFSALPASLTFIYDTLLPLGTNLLGVLQVDGIACGVAFNLAGNTPSTIYTSPYVVL